MARVIRGAEVRSAVVLSAVDEAEAIVARARRDAEAVRRELEADLAERAQADARASMVAALLRLEERAEAERLALRGEVTTLAMAVAEKVLGAELESRPERVAAWVDEALSRVARSRTALVRVHPDDVGALDLPADRVRPDDTLERGDCVVESELGVVDGRLSVKLAAVEAALRAGPA